MITRMDRENIKGGFRKGLGPTGKSPPNSGKGVDEHGEGGEKEWI